MAHTDEIDRALALHNAWKEWLLAAIESGSSEVGVTAVAATDHCEFGKWLKTLQDAGPEAQELAQVRKVHAQFHAEAAHVLGLALSGRKADAIAAMGPMSRYTALSMLLARCLGQWRTVLVAA